MASSDADPVGRVLEASGIVLERARLFGSRRPIVVAVSGGADSLCLLDATITLLAGAKQRIVVGHVDHCLRPESTADAEYVRSVSDGYGVRCEVFRVDVPALAQANRLGIEAAARLGRYSSLRELAAQTGAAAVVTGHTRDDSVETVLLHLMRGAGRRGLAGIGADEWLHPWILGEQCSASSPGLRVVRPLLDVGRADTVAYCEAQRIRWLTDQTNTDPAFLRNRVRGHLLPVLRTYNPAIDVALDRLSRVIRDEETFFDELVDQRYRSLVQQDGGRVAVSLRGWRGQLVALQRRFVRRIAVSLGYEEIGFEAVERALAVGSEGGPPRAELGGGLFVERRADTVVFDTMARGHDE